jgi:hypothetical protein
MAKETKTSPTPLSVMLGSGDFLIVKDKKYKVKPIALKDIEEFMSDELSIGSQLFNITNPERRKKVDRWLTGYCLDEKDNPINLETAMNEGWDIVDLKEFIKKLCDLSG